MLIQRAAPLWLSSLFLLISPSGFADPKTEDPVQLEYPELLVAPRASERLQLEARDEYTRRWATHLPIQASALSTLIAGAIQLGQPDLSNPPQSANTSGWAGVAVGSAWLLTTAILSFAYEPYQVGWNSVKARPSRTPREQLERERLSEEAINSPAYLGVRLKWLSFLSNAGASVYMLGVLNKGTYSPLADGVALTLSIAPLVFPYRWETTARDQETYKKKIYGPVAGAQLFSDRSGTLMPGVGLTIQF